MLIFVFDAWKVNDEFCYIRYSVKSGQKLSIIFPCDCILVLFGVERTSLDAFSSIPWYSFILFQMLIFSTIHVTPKLIKYLILYDVKTSLYCDHVPVVCSKQALLPIWCFYMKFNDLIFLWDCCVEFFRTMKKSVNYTYFFTEFQE